MKTLRNINSILANKMKLVSNKSDSYVRGNAYFCLKASCYASAIFAIFNL